MKFVATIVFMLVLCRYAVAMELWLYSHGSNAKFSLDAVQHCYTVKKLWADRAVRSKWEDLPKKSSIAFYKDVGCSGDSVKSSDTPSGSYSFEDKNKLNLAVSSFMMQQSSTYPTAGLVFIEADYPDLGEKTSLNASIKGN